MVVVKFDSFSLSQARATPQSTGRISPIRGGAGQNPSLRGIPPWVALMLEPWLDAIQRVGPGSTPWLREASAAMSECIREWVDLTPQIEDSLTGACDASDELVALIDGPCWGDAELQRQVTWAAMGGLIEALRGVEPCEEKASIGLGW